MNKQIEHQDMRLIIHWWVCLCCGHIHMCLMFVLSVACVMCACVMRTICSFNNSKLTKYAIYSIFVGLIGRPMVGSSRAWNIKLG